MPHLLPRRNRPQRGILAPCGGVGNQLRYWLARWEGPLLKPMLTPVRQGFCGCTRSIAQLGKLDALTSSDTRAASWSCDPMCEALVAHCMHVTPCSTCQTTNQP